MRGELDDEGLEEEGDGDGRGDGDDGGDGGDLDGGDTDGDGEAGEAEDGEGDGDGEGLDTALEDGDGKEARGRQQARENAMTGSEETSPGGYAPMSRPFPIHPAGAAMK